MFFNLFLVKVNHRGKLGEEEIEYELQSGVATFTKREHDRRNEAIEMKNNPLFGCSFYEAIKILEAGEYNSALTLMAIRCHHGDNRGHLRAYIVASDCEINSDILEIMLKNKDEKLLKIMNENAVTDELAKMLRY